MKSRYFHYDGYTFIPVAKLLNNRSLTTITRQLRVETTFRAGFSYEYSRFINGLREVSPDLDIVWCIEKRGYYIPCANGLYRYTGKVTETVDKTEIIHSIGGYNKFLLSM